MKKSEFPLVRDRIAKLPANRQAEIESMASHIVIAHHLSEIRKALSVTQTAVAAKTGLKQAEVSRIEKNPESVQIRTMARYVKGLGGQMKIVAEFPDGTQALIPLNNGKPVASKVTAAVQPERALRA